MSPLAFGIGKSRGTVFDPAVFYCNFLIFNWNWTDGKDFDIVAKFIEPNISGSVGAKKALRFKTLIKQSHIWNGVEIIPYPQTMDMNPS